MEYREIFAHPDKLARLIEKEMHTDIHTIIRSIAEEFIEDTDGDIYSLYEYFSQVYDDLYHALLFEKIHLHDETKKLLEFLATPIPERSPEEQREMILNYIKGELT